MKTFKCRGLVLREYEAGEADKRLVVLCKEFGKLIIYARGARKPKSKFLAASQVLTYGDYVVADGKQFFSMNQAEIIENFYPIRQDYDKLCHAQYVLEICEKTVPSRTECDQLLRLVLKTLQHISNVATDEITPNNNSKSVQLSTELALKQIVCVFLFRFFVFNGLAPEMESCCICGNELDAATIFCDEGMVCRECQKHKLSKTRMQISLAAQEAIRYILKSELNKAFMFEVEGSVLRELYRAAQLCWEGHFSVVLQSEV